MEKFLAEIEAYASAADTSPQSVLRRSCGYGWDVWSNWKAGQSSPTMASADRVRAWMASNPPKAEEAAE